ncbi:MULTISPECIES: glutathione transferase GstA [unclassified Pseudoxanthomonas]|uniref:glutathione transferase GstA n=1 Tax=unclassified Pseudoxanthomonas TaxID=2645906 RepID=UPI0008E22D2C|nr:MULTISPECIES: glutathione transferase GstA [unclassified Pseudoxanthomonas]PPJ41827.1 glutathione transferase GstA [Pseudoxanthomonas sp. KAs_5_3]SFV29528.1 glutathione S-transferase [Pseudoxanthomonas sp. YR558]
MRLYFKPGACSLSSRIVLTEIGLTYDASRVDTEAGLTESGADYRAVNPKGYVPALELDDGVVLSENPAILQFLADTHPESRLAPAYGTLERARLQEWLNFTSSELHKAFGPYFRGRPRERPEREEAELRLSRRVGDVERGLADGRQFIVGDSFTVADAYLFVVLNWSGFVGFDLAHWPHVAAYVARIGIRPSVRDAMRQEGLVTDEVAA